DEGHQIGGRLEAVEQRVAGGGEGPAAGRASVAAFLAAMDADVAQAELAPYGAVGVVAELALRVHRCASRGKVWRPCLEECRADPRFSSPYPPNHGSMGCYPTAPDSKETPSRPAPAHRPRGRRSTTGEAGPEG